MDLKTIRQEARAVAEELITTAQMKPGQTDSGSGMFFE